MSQESIYNALKKTGKFMTVREISKIADISEPAVRLAMSGLMSRGILETGFKIGTTSRFKVWRIKK